MYKITQLLTLLFMFFLSIPSNAARIQVKEIKTNVLYTINIDDSSSIYDLKKELFLVTEIPVEQQTIIAEKILSDDALIHSIPMHCQNKIKLIQKIQEVIRVREIVTDTFYTINIDDLSSIYTLKEKLFLLTGIPVEQQMIFAEKILEDHALIRSIPMGCRNKIKMVVSRK